ncbi:MAG: hypothetical protein GF350_09465 [Chitinivibrionales bacterium]|nr:hypothetical protein [Chitinivibrionales bacterium]
MIPSASHIAATILSSLPQRLLSERGKVVEKRSDATYVIKLSSREIVVQLSEGTLDAGDEVRLSGSGGEIVIEKNGGTASHTGQAVSENSVDSYTIDADLKSEDLPAKIEALALEVRQSPGEEIFREIAQVSRDVMRSLPESNRQVRRLVQDIIRLADAPLSENSKSVREQARTLAEMLTALKIELNARTETGTVVMEKTPALVLKGELDEALYFFNRAGDLAAWEPCKNGPVRMPVATLKRVAGSSDIIVRTVSSGTGATRALILSAADAENEIAHFMDADSLSPATRHISPDVIMAILRSRGTVSFEELRTIDQVLKNASQNGHAPVATTQRSIDLSLLQWIATALDNKDILGSFPQSPPITDSSTIPLSYETIAELAEKLDIPVKEFAESQISLTDKINDVNGDKRLLLQAILRQLGYSFEHDLAKSDGPDSVSSARSTTVKGELLQAATNAGSQATQPAPGSSSTTAAGKAGIALDLSLLNDALSRIVRVIDTLSAEAGSVSKDILEQVTQFEPELARRICMHNDSSQTQPAGNTTGSSPADVEKPAQSPQQNSARQSFAEGEENARPRPSNTAPLPENMRTARAVAEEASRIVRTMIRENSEARSTALMSMITNIREIAADVLARIEALLQLQASSPDTRMETAEPAASQSAQPAVSENNAGTDIAEKVSETAAGEPAKLTAALSTDAGKLADTIEMLLQNLSSKLPSSRPQAATITFAEIETLLLEAKKAISGQLNDATAQIRMNLEAILQKLSASIRQLIEMVADQAESVQKSRSGMAAGRVVENMNTMEKALRDLLANIDTKTAHMKSGISAITGSATQEIERFFGQVLGKTSEFELGSGARAGNRTANTVRAMSYYFSQQANSIAELSGNFRSTMTAFIDSSQQAVSGVVSEFRNALSGITDSQSGMSSSSGDAAFSASAKQHELGGRIAGLLDNLLGDLREMTESLKTQFRQSAGSLRERAESLLDTAAGRTGKAMPEGAVREGPGNTGTQSDTQTGVLHDVEHLMRALREASSAHIPGGEMESVRRGAAGQKEILRQIEVMIRSLIGSKENIENGLLHTATNRLQEMNSSLQRLSGEMMRQLESSLQGGRENAQERLPLEMFRQNIETALNRFEALQMLARPVATAEGEQQVLAVPMKIQGEWTDVRIMFVKRGPAGKKKASRKNYSVVINTSPSFLGEINAKIDYTPKKSFRLRLEIENDSTREWFSKNSDPLTGAFQSLGFSFVQIEFGTLQKTGAVVPATGRDTEKRGTHDGKIDVRI